MDMQVKARKLAQAELEKAAQHHIVIWCIEKRQRGIVHLLNLVPMIDIVVVLLDSTANPSGMHYQLPTHQAVHVHS